MTIYTDKDLPERREADHYPTPRWAVEAAMETICDSFVVEESWPVRILDVGAGDGIWGTVAREVFKDGVEITGVELRDLKGVNAYDTWLKGDFFDPTVQSLLRCHAPFDLIMGNPPFGCVEPIIDACWPLLSRPLDYKMDADSGEDAWAALWGGRLAFFLRLAFLEGQKRRDGLFAEHPLTTLGVYSKRVSFQPNGKTNATAHALFLWQLGHPGFRSGLRFF